MHHPGQQTNPTIAPGTLLSVVGLVAWLLGHDAGNRGPARGTVPPLLIVGWWFFRRIFRVVLLPKLIGVGKQDDAITNVTPERCTQF